MLKYDTSRLHRSQSAVETVDFHEWVAPSRAVNGVTAEYVPTSYTSRSLRSCESREVSVLDDDSDHRPHYVPSSSSFFGGVAKAQLVTRHETADFLELYYEHVKPIGKGTFGSVHLVRDRSTGSQRVCKEINFAEDVCDKPQKLLELTRQELQLLCELDHPHIVKLFECCEDMDARRSVLIMEHIDGGDCYYLLAKALEGLQEPLVCTIMQQTLVALGYCHGKGVLHRDVKSSNILLKKTPVWGRPLCMLVDFGLAARQPSAREAVCARGEYVGTPSYFSPEVVASKYYTAKSDVWAAGILAVELITGTLAFGRAKDHQGDVRLLFRAILGFRGLQDFNSRLGNLSSWEDRSPAASRWLEKLLEVEPTRRLSAREAANDPVCSLHTSASGLTTQIVQSLANYADASPPVRCCLLLIAVRSNLPDSYQFAAAFKDADVDGDGTISKEDLSIAIERSSNWWDPEIDIPTLIDMADLDNSGGLSYSEFVAACMFDIEGSIERLANDAFTALDTDRDGRIVVREVRDAFPELETFVLYKFSKDRDLSRAEWCRHYVSACRSLGGILPGQGAVLSCGADIMQCGPISNTKQPALHTDAFGLPTCGAELMPCGQLDQDLQCGVPHAAQGCEGDQDESDMEDQHWEDVRQRPRKKKGHIDAFSCFSCAGDD